MCPPGGDSTGQEEGAWHVPQASLEPGIYPTHILPCASDVPYVSPRDNAGLFPRAAMSEHHRLRGLEQHRCIVSALEAGSERSVCQQGMFSDRGCLARSAPDPSLGSRCHPVLRVPWPGGTPLQSGFPCHMASSRVSVFTWRPSLSFCASSSCPTGCGAHSAPV